MQALADLEAGRGLDLKPESRWIYSGPGWREWMLGLSATAMAVAGLAGLSALDEPQTAAGYYGREAWVRPLHHAAFGLQAAVILLVMAGIARRGRGFIAGLTALSGAILALVWIELVLAAWTSARADYVFQSLPFSPINSGGLAGAIACSTYLILRISDSGLGAWRSLGLKLMLAAAGAAGQWAAWEMVRTAAGLPSPGA
jgi:hypothetical protein